MTLDGLIDRILKDVTSAGTIDYSAHYVFELFELHSDRTFSSRFGWLVGNRFGISPYPVKQVKFDPGGRLFGVTHLGQADGVEEMPNSRGTAVFFMVKAIICNRAYKLPIIRGVFGDFSL